MGEQESRPFLFQVYPELEGKVPWVPTGVFPTPVEQLGHLGFENLWIKRDDQTSPAYGGNKVRKLEFILGDILSKKKTKVITFGGIGTNHGLATAIFCKQYHIDCTLLLFEQPVTRNVKQNLLLFFKYNADIIYTKSLLNTVLSYFVCQRLRNPSAYFLYPGGSTIHGALGYVNAAFELKTQIDQGLVPEPAIIFCPVGTCGTMAGLILGTKLAGLNSKVMGVRVTQSHLGPFSVCTGDTVKKLVEQTHGYLKSLSKRIPNVDLGTPRLLGEYLGEGYGFPTKKGAQAYHALKAKENIVLDPCYTSKTFAAVMDHCRTHAGDSDPVLFWHTYNSVDLSNQAGSVEVNCLPVEIQRFIYREEMGYESTWQKSSAHTGGKMEDNITPGAPAPDFSFNTPWKTSLRFHDCLENKKTVLIFLRYIGCPLCQLRISEMINEKQLFDTEDIQAFVVLQSAPENLREIYQESDMPFTIICDPGEDVFRLYKVFPGSFLRYITPGVVLKALKAKKQGFEHGKKEGSELQLPAVFVIDADKTIQNAYYGKNVGDMPDNRALMEMVRA